MLTDITRHPLLQPQKVDDVLTYFAVYNSHMLLEEIIPFVEEDVDRIVMDIEQADRGGMTPAVAMGTDVPIYQSFTRGRLEWDPMQFSEKVILTEKDMVHFRDIGDLNARKTAAQILARRYSAIQARLARRVEYMRRQTLFGGVVSVTTADGEQLVVNYQHADYLEPTTGTFWDNAAADPLDDMQLWAEDYIAATGFGVKKIWLPHGTLRTLTANTKFQTIQENSYGSFAGDKASVRGILAQHVGLSAIEESSHRLDLQTSLAADVAAAATTLVLNDVELIEVGSRMVLKARSNMYSEQVTVTAVNTATKTVTLSAAILNPDGYAAGDPVKHHLFTIPLNRLLFVGSPLGMNLSMENSEGGVNVSRMEKWADFCSTRVYNGPNFAPRTGIITRLVDMQDQIVPRVEQQILMRGLPRVHYQEGWMTPQILA